MKIYQKRQQQLLSLLDESKLDMILMYSTNADSRYSKWVAGVTAQSFHYYFIGFKTSGFLEINYLAADLQAKTGENIIEIADSDISTQLATFLSEYEDIGLVGDVPFPHLAELLGTKRLVEMTGLVDELLVSKEESEMSAITSAAQILDKAFAQAAKLIKPGVNTAELAKQLKLSLLDQSDSLAFPISVATKMHLRESTVAMPDSTTIIENDVVCIDMGVVQNGYYTDATRMFFIGEQTTSTQYKLLCKINQEIVAWLKPGVTLQEMVSKFQVLIKESNLNACLETEDLGHSIGFGLHEYPVFYQESQAGIRLVENMIITLEPELVFQGYRLRVENMVQITANGAKVII